MPGGYRARQDVLLVKAIQHGIRPTPLAISRATGISLSTVKRMLAGDTISIRTMGLLADTLDGGSTEALFEWVSHDTPPPPPLR
jgi:hypothetical protein